MTRDELVQALRDMAINLGRVPKRDEFASQIKNGRHFITLHFGSYATLLQASGLKEETQSRKIDGSIFQKSIVDHLKNHYENLSPSQILEWPTFASISDIHWPYENQRVIDRFFDYVKEFKPEWVIINGDAWDMYSHSKFPRSHNEFTPREEQRLAREKNEAFWKKIQEISPKSKCYQLLGNHDIRPMKRVLEAYPEAEDWITEKLKELFTFEGVTTYHDAREELELPNDILVFHGYKSKLGAHRDYTLMSTVNGHTHKGGSVFRKIRGRILFELNSGFAGDHSAKGLTYTPQRITDQTEGFAACDKWGPRFIPV